MSTMYSDRVQHFELLGFSCINTAEILAANSILSHIHTHHACIFAKQTKTRIFLSPCILYDVKFYCVRGNRKER